MTETATTTTAVQMRIGSFSTHLRIAGVKGRINVIPRFDGLVEPFSVQPFIDAANRLMLVHQGLVPTGDWWEDSEPGAEMGDWRVQSVRHPQFCEACVYGCECDEDGSGTGCEHYQCWGSARLPIACKFAILLNETAIEQRHI